MKKIIVIIGGGESWDSDAAYEQYVQEKKYDPYEVRNDGWKKLLSGSLGDAYEVIVPPMPSKENAKYTQWCIWMKKITPFIKESAILIGHSLGANFLAKYLSEHRMPCVIDQLHLVAGCYGASGGFVIDEQLHAVSQQCEQIYIYHSTDDRIVSCNDAYQYHRSLPDAHFELFSDRGHFLDDDFPELVHHIKNA